LLTVSPEYVDDVRLSSGSQCVTETRQQTVVLTEQNVQQFVHFLGVYTLSLYTTSGRVTVM